MKIRVLMVLLIFIFCSFLLHSETIKIGYFELEPYVGGQAGQKPTGASVDYWEKHLAPQMGVTIEWVGPLTVPRLLKDLESGAIDAIVLMAKNPERASKFLFPSQPYTTQEASIVVLKTSPIKKINKIEELYGLNIGYHAGAFVPPYMKNDKIKIDFTTSETYKQDNFNKLLKGRIDCIFDVNDISNLIEAKMFGHSDKIRLIKLPVAPTNIYSLFVNSDRGKSFLAAYEKANNKLVKQGVYDKLLKAYLK